MTNLKQFANNIFYTSADHGFDQPCLYAIVGQDKTLMIDGGVSAGLSRRFIEAVRSATGRGVDYCALTHWHWDHVFGLPGVDAPVIACANTAAHLRRMAGYASWSDEALENRLRSGEEIPFCAENIKKVYPGDSRGDIVIRLPDIVFDGMLRLDLGGLTCELLPLPPVHTNDCVAIHVPEHRLLFIGDSTGQNSYDHPAHYSAPAVIELFAWIDRMDAMLIMESHGEPATAQEFHACNDILLDAADGILTGCRDRESLMEHLRAKYGDDLPEESEEVAGLFINGCGR